MTANADMQHKVGERRHLPECPQFCPYPDLTYCMPGASLPKCRGGDCTRCDEFDCICDALRACEQRVLDAAREAAIRALTDDDGFVRQSELDDVLEYIDALREEQK